MYYVDHARWAGITCVMRIWCVSVSVMKLTKGEADRMYDVLRQEQIDEIIRSLKLRELIEKEELDTEETFCGECWDTIRKLLLEESKKN